MTKVINAYEAPALLDAHSSLTRHALYHRLTGEPEPHRRPGLSSHLADGTLRFAQGEYGWAPPVKKTFEHSSPTGLTAQASAYVTADEEGPLVVAFLHLADFVHRMSWAKAGTPPIDFIIQASWIMWLSDNARLAYLVLTDKRLSLYYVQRDNTIVERLQSGFDAMAAAVNALTPPPVDTSPDPSLHAHLAADSSKPANLDDLVRRFRDAKAIRATTVNAATNAEYAYEAAADLLKAKLPKGHHHDCDGYRIHHNAKTGRLTEEKLDGLYF